MCHSLIAPANRQVGKRATANKAAKNTRCIFESCDVAGHRCVSRPDISIHRELVSQCPLQHLCSINMAVRRSVENGQRLAPDCRSCGTERPCTSAKTSGFAYGFGTSCNADRVQARTPTARWYSRTPGCRMSCSQRPANHSGTKPFGRNERIYKSRATFTPVESRFIFISLQQPDERQLSPFSCRGRTASPSTSSRQRVPL